MTTSESMPRLNKALAQAGICARRKADELIFAGAVTVNGEIVIEPGRRVDPENDHIEVNGSPLLATPSPCHLMLHKPVRVVSTARDPEGRPTVLELVPPPWNERRLYPVGRLDFFSEGLLVLTDDGELANRLAHPRHHLPRLYEVLVRGRVTDHSVGIMRKGMMLSEGEQLAPIEVMQSYQGGNTLLTLTLHQGVNRQIRRMCRDLRLTVLRLVRIGLGSLRLGDLAPGEVRALTAAELDSLRK